MRALLRFIEHTMPLPEELEIEYEREMEEFEKAQKNKDLSRFERRGLQRGLEQGQIAGQTRGDRRCPGGPVRESPKEGEQSSQ